MTEDKVKLIVLVEDDQIVNESLCDLLELSGYRVLSSLNGEDGLQLIRDNRDHISLIISDIMMPVMDGLELLSHVMADKKMRCLPFIFLSAKNDKSTIKDALKNGAIDFIEKPFKNHEVLSTIESVIEKGADYSNNTRLQSELNEMEQKFAQVKTGENADKRSVHGKVRSIADLLESGAIGEQDAVQILSATGNITLSEKETFESVLDRLTPFAHQNDDILLSRTPRHIYLIDDDQTLNSVHKLMIQKHTGVIPITFTDPKEALNRIIEADQTPDLIILDLIMPGMHGLEFLEQLEKNEVDTDVIILSSSKNTEHISGSLKHNRVLSYLNKPLTAKVLKRLRDGTIVQHTTS